MARTKDLWTATVKGPDDKPVKKRTARYGKGKRWLAEWTGADGRPATRAFDRKSDAENYGTTQEADQLRGTYIDPKRGNVTLREYGEGKYLPSQFHLRANSAETYASHLRNHIYPALGGRRMGSLERTDMKSFVALLAAKLAPTTTETVFTVLRALMQSAVDDKVIPANPCSRVPLPKAEKRVVEPMAAAAVLALADAITPRYRVMVVLGAGAGLREGEAFGLTVPRVDFLRRKLHIRDQAQRGATAAPLKTKASMRVIPADDWVLAEITAHMQAYAPGPGQVIVTNRLGRVAKRNSFGSCWREAVDRARTCGNLRRSIRAGRQVRRGVRGSGALPAEGTRFHDLRHFYASALIAANLNPKVIQARLGPPRSPRRWTLTATCSPTARTWAAA